VKGTLRLISETVRIVDARLETDININCIILDEISVFLYPKRDNLKGNSDPWLSHAKVSVDVLGKA
jgi:hypothetical protein